MTLSSILLNEIYEDMTKVKKKCKDRETSKMWQQYLRDKGGAGGEGKLNQ